MECSSRWDSLRAHCTLLASDAVCSDMACNIVCAAHPLEAAAAAHVCSVWSNFLFLPAISAKETMWNDMLKGGLSTGA
eukprot:9498296-Pyramimonas_sp.AAC.1